MNFEEIANLTIENSLGFLLLRLFEVDDLKYLVIEGDDPFYDRIVFTDNRFEKPSLEVLENELNSYKQELANKYQEILDEQKRIEVLTERFNSIADIRNAIKKAGYDIRNPALELQRIVLANDSDRLSQYEIAMAEIDQENKITVNINELKQKGRQARELCQRVLDLIAGHNITRKFSVDEIQELKNRFAVIKSFLQDSQPWSAKKHIENIVADGYFITNDIKQDILREFDQSGLF